MLITGTTTTRAVTGATIGNKCPDFSGKTCTRAISSDSVFSFALVFASSATAQFSQCNAGGRTRCVILGPMIVSACFGLLEKADRRDREGNRDAIATLTKSEMLCDATACSMTGSESTLDCLTAMAMAGEFTKGLSLAARACMTEVNLPRR